MTEPANLTLVVIGNLTDDDPWHLEFWGRDDTNAAYSTARWFRAGLGDDGPVQRVSWDWLEVHARDLGSAITVLSESAR